MQNFYEHQEVAKRNLSTLILMMYGAILGTVLVTGLIVTASLFGTWYYFFGYDAPRSGRFVYQAANTLESIQIYLMNLNSGEFPWDLALFWYATLTTATGAVVVSATYAKVKSLRKGGGASVAEALGGVNASIDPRPFESDDGGQRRRVPCRIGLCL